MRIFISWSGDRSKAMAKALYEWLPLVLPGAKPWISTAIARGSRWAQELSTALDQANAGLICVTEDNLTSPWLLFEAGALSKTFDHVGLVVPVLLDNSPDELEDSPLTQFQAVGIQKEEIRALIMDLNKQMTEVALTQHQLDTFFDRSWLDLERVLEQIPDPIVKPFQLVILHDKYITIDISSRYDELWCEFIGGFVEALPNFPEESFRIAPIRINDLQHLDLVAERWIEPPTKLSKLKTTRIALVSRKWVEAWQSNANIASIIIKTEIRPHSKKWEEQ